MKNKTSKLRVASIGLGWVTLNRHLPVMDESNLYEVIGVIDHHKGKAEEIAKQRKYKYFQETNVLENVPWLNMADAITIGTSPHSHYDLIKSALNLNKHVLTEKPFTLSVDEGKELVALAEKKGLTLGIVHNFQFASSTRKLLYDMQEGKFGKIKSIYAQQFSNPRRRLPKWYEQLPLGLFYDESPHFFYLISRLAPGPLEFLSSNIFSSTTGLITPSLIDIKYYSESLEHGRIPVTVNMNFEAPISEWHIVVCGEEFLGDIDIFRDIYICLPNDGLHVTDTVLRTSLSTTWQHWSQHFTSGTKHLLGRLRYGNEIVFKSFAEAILNKKQLKYISATDALNVLKMQHKVIESSNVYIKDKCIYN